MTLKLDLNMKLEQRLVLTPQLQMAIKLLQLTKLELQELVAKEMLENPTLEEAEVSEETEVPVGLGDETEHPVEALPADAPDGGAVAPESPADSEPPVIEHEVNREIAEVAQAVGTQQPADQEMDWDAYFEHLQTGATEGGAAVIRDDEDRTPFEQMVTKKQGLQDYLRWQLRLTRMTEEELAVGEELIGNINDEGYLKEVSLEDLAERLGKPLPLVERVHRRVLQFDPVGVGARDLRECLSAQVKYLFPHALLAGRILRDAWEELTHRNIPALSRKLKVTREETLVALKIIQGLDPRPGSRFNNEQPEYIVPDIYVQKVGDEYHILLNEDGMPRLKISGDYQRMLQQRGRGGDGEARDYVRGKLRAATWLIRSIRQRQRTIYRVTEAIVARQREFLDKGVAHLKPMVLRDIADDIGMSESTVSRVTTNKYVHTPQGIMELKDFFHVGIENDAGEAIASESIKTRIKQLVDGEDKRRPISDQKLVELLKRENIVVARRTIAKYRQMMSLLPSSQRKQMY